MAGLDVPARAGGTLPARLDMGLKAPGGCIFSPDEPTLIWKDPRQGGDGSYCVNDAKDRVQWRWRLAKLNNVFSTRCADTSSLAPNPFIIDFGAQEVSGDSEVAAFFGRDASGGGSRFGLRPYLGAPFNRDLSNVVISSNLVLGTSQLPGYLASPLYVFPNSDLNFRVCEFAGTPTVQLGAFCRTFDDLGCESAGDARRRAKLADPAYPCWIGPQSKNNPATTGPQITLLAGGTVQLRFPAPTDADVLVGWILDDSSSTTGVEPVVNVIITEEDTTEQLIDDNNGIPLRNFVACPTVTVTGMPTGGVVRAMSLKSPRGGWTHQIRRNSALLMTLVSGDAGTVTLRLALHGWMLPFKEDVDRRYAAIPDRATRMPSVGIGLGGGT